MTKNILVPITKDDILFDYILDKIKSYANSDTIFTIYHVKENNELNFIYPYSSISSHCKKEMFYLFDHYFKLLKENDIRFIFKSEVGDRYSNILTLPNSEDFSLVIIGSEDFYSTKSVARYVFSHSSIPVIVVKK